MKILLVGDFTYEVYAPAFKKGFEKNGHSVVCVRYNDYLYNNVWIGNLLSKVQNRCHWGYKMFKYNNDIIRIALHETPDFIFFYRCYHVWQRTVEKLKKTGNIIVTYNNDDPFCRIPSKSYFRNFYNLIKKGDINFVYRKKNIADYESIGARTPSILLPYFMEDKNFYEACPDDIDISYLGHFEHDGRDASLSELIKAGLNLEIYSTSYWESSKYYNILAPYIKPGVSGLEYNHNINRSKIALVFLSKTNHDTYTRRCFEIPATKTLMLSEYTDDLAKMFPPDVCAVYFRNNTELVEKAKYLIGNPLEISRIAENGYRRLIELGGSEVDRTKQVVNIVNDYKIYG